MDNPYPPYEELTAEMLKEYALLCRQQPNAPWYQLWGMLTDEQKDKEAEAWAKSIAEDAYRERDI